MIFWTGIIVSGLFVLWAVRKGFYETWVTLFNSVISIYLAIFLRATVSELIPAVADTPYSNALIVFLLFFASFAILTSLSYIFFTSQFDVPFPRVLDYIGSGIIGFFNGLLLWSFLCLLISLTPLGQNDFLVGYGFESNFQNSNIAYIKKFIDPVNLLVSSKSNFLSTDLMISDLVKESEKTQIQEKPSTLISDPNKIYEPNSISEPNKTSGYIH